MGEQLLLGVFIGICILALIGTMTNSKLIHFMTRGCISSVMILVMNCLMPQYMIGFNLYTIMFSTVLGLPGLMTLYVFQMIV